MKNTIKKVSTIVLSLAAVCAMSISAFAAESNGETNVSGGIVTADNTINIAKQIVFINEEETSVREPNIAYTYTISAANGGATITDSNDISAQVKTGVIAANTNEGHQATVVFTDTEAAMANANGTGAADIKYAELTFEPSAFGEAGIYRYQITETSNVEKNTVGIIAADNYNANRFLDVYVKWSDDDHKGLEIYGYVLFEGSANQTISSTDVSMKSAGYVNKSTEEGKQYDVDVYTTQNLYIHKTTTGSMADKSHDFPITLTFENIISAKVDVAITSAQLDGIKEDTLGKYVNLTETMTGKIQDGSIISVKGIPTNATVSIVEKNNSTDSYKVKAGKEEKGSDLLQEAIVAAGADAAATEVQTLSTTVKIFFTNTLEAISPTGVVLRFGPYFLMLAAGAALFILARRRKSRREED